MGPPNIVRIHGRSEPVFRDDAPRGELISYFPDIDTSLDAYPAYRCHCLRVQTVGHSREEAVRFCSRR